MSIPYSDKIKWDAYQNDQFIDNRGNAVPVGSKQDLFNRAVKEVFVCSISQLKTRSVQFVRDALRLVLKVPIRAVKTPFIFKKYWKQCENAKINAKLTGYSFVHLLYVPVKFAVALAALATLSVSAAKAQWLLDKCDEGSAYLDGRASQLEALKEEGLKNATMKQPILDKDSKPETPEEEVLRYDDERALYNSYKQWLYRIDPRMCRQ